MVSSRWRMVHLSRRCHQNPCEAKQRSREERVTLLAQEGLEAGGLLSTLEEDDSSSMARRKRESTGFFSNDVKSKFFLQIRVRT